MSNFKDVYERVTAQIIEAIEKGSAEFRMPWHSSGPRFYEPMNAASKKRYRGINVIALWAAAEAREYESGLWATYKQWSELGAQVRKGEQGTCIVLWKAVDRARGLNDNGEAESDKFFLARGFSVFNAAQVDGYRIAEPAALSEVERIEQAERFFATLGAEISHGGQRAYYNITLDNIVLPPFERFLSPMSYYATLAHEITHWSGASHRLGRDYGTRERMDVYALEELIAELGAAFLCARLELPAERRMDHAAYLQDWLRVLKQDKRAIFTAAAKAQQAADWLCEQSLKVADAA